MNLYSSLKEIYKDTTKIVHDKDLADKIVCFLKILSFVVVCMIYIVEKCGLRTLISYNIEIEIPSVISNFLSKYILIIIVIYVIYFLLINTIIKYILIELEVRLKKELLPVGFTLQDILRTTFYSIILLKMLQDMILCIEGNDVLLDDNLIVYVYIVFNVVIRFIGKVHIQNKNSWYYQTMKYTVFFDSEGKRIAENDNVVYKNQIHKLCKENGMWMLSDDSGKCVVKLEDAVKDMDGGVKVCFYSTGKRNEDDATV